MDFLTEHLLDIAVILIAITTFLYGYKRGILRMAISLAGIIFAIITASFIADISHVYIYDNFIKDAVITLIEEKSEEITARYNPEKALIEELSKMDISLSDTEISSLFDENSVENEESVLTSDEIRDTLNSVYLNYCEMLTDALAAVDILPNEVVSRSDEYLLEKEREISEKAAILGNKNESLINSIEENIIRGPMLVIVKNVVFFAVFIIVNILVSFIIRLAGFVRQIPLVKSADSFFGAILGIVYGAVYIAILVLLSELFINFTADKNPIINSKIIENSYIYKYAYDIIFSIIS